MSKLGKIFLWIALAGALASVVVGYMLSQQYGSTKQDLATSKNKEQQTAKQLVTTQGELKDAQDAQKTAEQKAADAQSKVDGLNNQLTEAQKSADDAKAALQTAQNDAKAAQQKYDDYVAKMDGKTPDDYKAMVTQAQKDAADAQTQQKVLQDSLDQANQKVKDLIADINNEKNGGHLPPGISGKVTFVDNTWNFVVLDVGLDAGVVPNGELIVYRGKKFLGKVRVTRADPNDSVAEIMPDLKGNIQVGDAVLN